MGVYPVLLRPWMPSPVFLQGQQENKMHRRENVIMKAGIRVVWSQVNI